MTAAEWNATHPVGTRVRYAPPPWAWMATQCTFIAVTTSAARDVDGQVVVEIQGDDSAFRVTVRASRLEALK